MSQYPAETLFEFTARARIAMAAIAERDGLQGSAGRSNS